MHKGSFFKKIETIIGPNTNFNGQLVCHGNVRIDGVCEASVIETRGDIVISPLAKVAAHLVAENISVSGAVLGKIEASNRVEILGTGQVWGEVSTGDFVLDEEGYFKGKLILKNEPEPPF